MHIKTNRYKYYKNRVAAFTANLTQHFAVCLVFKYLFLMQCVAICNFLLTFIYKKYIFILMQFFVTVNREGVGFGSLGSSFQRLQ